MSQLSETKAFAVKLKDSQQLQRSSSGGAFTAISDVFLSRGEAVVSPVYNYETSQTEFVLYDTTQVRDEARGSKYMQSYPLNIFREAESWLKSNVAICCLLELDAKPMASGDIWNHGD